jgi:hypothetical protein
MQPGSVTPDIPQTSLDVLLAAAMRVWQTLFSAGAVAPLRGVAARPKRGLTGSSGTGTAFGCPFLTRSCRIAGAGSTSPVAVAVASWWFVSTWLKEAPVASAGSSASTASTANGHATCSTDEQKVLKACFALFKALWCCI